MAQPPRPGFIVKNAIDPDVGSNLDIAEPDANDFNLLGNGRFGVIDGCAVSATSSSAVISVAAGVYVVDGALVGLPSGGQFTLSSASQYARFDLIVGDAAGTVSGIKGDASVNPVFPNYPNNVTVFAAVMVRSGTTVVEQKDITDKRVMLPQRFTTAMTSGSIFHNGDPGNALAPLFDIDWNGRHQWDGDAFLERDSATTQTLKVTKHLNVMETLHARDETLDGTLVAAGDVTADNLKQGTINPTVPGKNGDLYRNRVSGTLWLYEAGEWKQLATTPIPTGFTMMGFTTTAPPGWLLVNGQLVAKAAAGGLWDACPDWQKLVGGEQFVQIPDARNCFYGWGAPGAKLGNPTSQITLTTDNLPSHRHLTDASGQMVPAGAHTHTASTNVTGGHVHGNSGFPEGQHTHEVKDLGHLHIPQYDQGGFVCAVWQGQNKLDGYFNDASHTYTVEPLPYTNFGKADIICDFSGVHTHSMTAGGSHNHTVTISTDGTNHTHPINEQPVGQNVPINILPPFMGLYLYVKM